MFNFRRFPVKLDNLFVGLVDQGVVLGNIALRYLALKVGMIEAERDIVGRDAAIVTADRRPTMPGGVILEILDPDGVSDVLEALVDV